MVTLADLVSRLDPAFPAPAAAVFVIFMVPIWFYMSWCDMAKLKIRNGLVLLVFGLFIAIGPLVLPFDLYLWQLVQAIIVFAIMLGLYSGGLMGGGDAKFIAAASPLFLREDMALILMLSCASMLGAFACHRLFRLAGADKVTPLWRSWRSGQRFPLGFALGGIVVFYLGLSLV